MRIWKFGIVVFFFSITQSIAGRNYYSSVDSTSGLHSIFFEAAYGMGKVNNEFSRMTAYFEVGYKNIVVTERLFRTTGNRFNVYEDAWMVGYRFNFKYGFKTTFSAGYSDLAFLKNNIYYNPDISTVEKYPGLSFSSELEWAIPNHRRESIFSLTGMYYTVFNSHGNLNGFALGLKFCPMRLTKESQEVRNDRRKRLRMSADSTVYKYYIRTNLITGIIFSPHFDFECHFRKKWGWGISIFSRPDADWRPRYYIVSENPDFQLHGYGGFADLLYYGENWWNSHHWTFGLRLGFRNLYGSCAIGGNIGTPDYYVYRTRQDIVTAIRVANVIPSKQTHFVFDWFFVVGARTSFYQTRFPQNSFFQNGYGFNYPKAGCYVLPNLNGGLEMGFGW